MPPTNGLPVKWCRAPAITIMFRARSLLAEGDKLVSEVHAGAGTTIALSASIIPPLYSGHFVQASDLASYRVMNMACVCCLRRRYWTIAGLRCRPD